MAFIIVADLAARRGLGRDKLPGHKTRLMRRCDLIVHRESLAGDRILFDQLLANMLSQLEMTSWLIDAGLMTEDDLAPINWFLEHKVFCYPGAREWLDELPVELF